MRLASMCSHRRVSALATSLAALLFAHPAHADDPVLLSIFGGFGQGSLYYSAQLEGDIVYMAAWDSLYVVDVSDPTQPSQLVRFSLLLGNLAISLEVVGDRVYLGSSSAGPFLQVLGVANPAAPVSLGAWSGPFPVGNFEVVGDIVYAAGQFGLLILDVSALPSIVELGSFGSLESPERLSSVAVSESHAYGAAEAAGLFIIDISDPSMPEHVGTIPGSVFSVDVVGAHLYVGGDEFRIFDVSSSGSPVLVGQAAIELVDCRHLRVNEAEGLAYCAEYVIDVSDVEQPVLAVKLPITPFVPGAIGGSDGIDGIVYVPEAFQGLHVFRIFPPFRPLPGLGGLAALPLALLGWRALRKRGRIRSASEMGSGPS